MKARWTNKAALSRLTRLYGPGLLLLCAVQAWHPLRAADDIWAHAAIGRWIWQHGRAPSETLFLWGRAPIEWVYHSWLSQLTFYGLLENGGPLAIALFTMALCCLPFWLLWREWNRKTPAVAGDFAPFIFALAIWCSAPRFRPRPELFTALFLTLLLLFLIRWTRQPLHEKPLLRLRRNLAGVLGIAALFVAWANFHGAVALGLALLFLTMLCDFLQDRGADRARALAAVALLAATVIWINPYGLEYSAALRPVGGAMFSAINEWKPFWQYPPMSVSYALAEGALAALALLAWWSSLQRRWAHAAWVLFMAASFLDARRQLWLTALTCLAVIAAAAPQWNALRLGQACGEFWEKYFAQSVAARSVAARSVAARSTPLPAPVRLFFALAPLIFLLAITGATLRRQTWAPRGVSPQLPEGAARFLEKHPPRGRLFTDYEDSSYWQWQFTGAPPLYIDLLNAYPDDLMTDYLQIAHAEPRGLRLLDRLKIGTVVLRAPRSERGLGRLAAFLDRSPQWQRIYAGHNATVWARKK